MGTGRFEGKSGKQNRLSVLKENKIIAGDESIAKFIDQHSKKITFTRGETIITEGDDGDDVYFLLSGQVKVSINGKSRKPLRKAPEQVGEMSAINKMDKRSATVIADDEFVDVLKISASKFNEIRSNNHEFNGRALKDQNDRNKEWKRPKTESNLSVVKMDYKFISFICFSIFPIPIVLYFSENNSITLLIALFVLYLGLLSCVYYFLGISRSFYFASLSTALAAVFHALPILNFRFEFNFGQIIGHIESPSEINWLTLVCLIVLTIILFYFGKTVDHNSN